MANVQITGFGRGGGVVKHTIYKVDVSLGGGSWSVWRRYNQFKELNDRIGQYVQIGGNEKDTEAWFGQGTPSQLFPPKAYPNSDSVVRDRMVTLNAWLLKVMAFRPSANLKQRVEESLNTFFDAINKGKSGLMVDAGRDENKQLVRESFLRVKMTNSLFFGVYYVGLTKDNTLYFCKSIYDKPHDAIKVVKLNAPFAKINVYMQGELNFQIAGEGTDIVLSFKNRDDTTSWFRLFSDACVPDPLEKISPSKRREMHVEEQRRKQEERERASQDLARSRGKEDVFLGSTGNTADLLSASYGV